MPFAFGSLSFPVALPREVSVWGAFLVAVARIAAEYPLVDLSVREPDIESVIAKMYAERAGA